MTQVRRTNAVGAQQAALPFDFDFLNFLLRDDLVARYAAETGRPEPNTFEELADCGEHFMGPRARVCSGGGGIVAAASR